MQRMELGTVGTGELLRRLVENLQRLVDREIRLFRTEIRSDVSHTIRGSELLIAGGLLLYAGAIMMLVFLALVFAPIVPSWALALIFGLLLGISGALLALIGKRQISMMPLQKTRESLEEDLAWTRRQLTLSER